MDAEKNSLKFEIGMFDLVFMPSSYIRYYRDAEKKTELISDLEKIICYGAMAIIEATRLGVYYYGGLKLYDIIK